MVIFIAVICLIITYLVLKHFWSKYQNLKSPGINYWTLFQAFLKISPEQSFCGYLGNLQEISQKWCFIHEHFLHKLCLDWRF